jgi:hypothetical protein
VFQRNEDARRFYERQGCVLVELTDGAGNEEREPDALYAWRPAGSDSLTPVDEGVRLTVVSSEMEAEALCGLLRSAGIECGYRPTEEQDSPFEGFASEGRQEVLVHERDLDDAQTLIADTAG